MVWSRRCVKPSQALGIQLVDLHGLNVLTEARYIQLCCIDIDSYQTANYAATALDPAVRDYHAPAYTFTPDSDWFSFAVLSCQLLLGIHPYRGKHKRVTGLEARMRTDLSILGNDVRVPPASVSTRSLPTSCAAWLEVVFERGMRTPPPCFGPATTFSLSSPQPLAADNARLRIRSY